MYRSVQSSARLAREKEVMKRELSVPRQQLIDVMQNLSYGEIIGLNVQNGEPVLKPKPKIVRKIKCDKHNGLSSKAALNDFALCNVHLTLFKSIDDVRNGVIDSITIQNGLPNCITVSEGMNA